MRDHQCWNFFLSLLLLLIFNQAKEDERDDHRSNSPSTYIKMIFNLSQSPHIKYIRDTCIISLGGIISSSSYFPSISLFLFSLYVTLSSLWIASRDFYPIFPDTSTGNWYVDRIPWIFDLFLMHKMCYFSYINLRY